MIGRWTAALLAWIVLGAGVIAHAQAQSVVEVGEVSGVAGELVRVPLRAGGDFAAAQWDLIFDPGALEFVDVNLVHGCNHATDHAEIEPGRVRVVVYPLACPIGYLPPILKQGSGGADMLKNDTLGIEGELVLRIKAGAQGGNYPVGLSDPQMVDADGLPWQPQAEAGQVSVSGSGVGPHPIPGPGGTLLLLLGAALALAAAVVGRRGLAMLALGVLAFGLMPRETFAQPAPSLVSVVDVILGRDDDAAADCNGDGRIDVADLICAQQAHCAGGVPPVGLALAQASPNGPVTFLSASGWRAEISGTQILVQHPDDEAEAVRYEFDGTTESMGQTAPWHWNGSRRTILFPDWSMTMHVDGSCLAEVSLYDGDESHGIDLRRQLVVHSSDDAQTSQAREEAEADGWAARVDDLDMGWGKLTHLMEWYREDAAADGSPEPLQAGAALLSVQPWGTDDALAPWELASPIRSEEVGACGELGQLRGGLTQEGGSGQPIYYRSRNDHVIVTINKHTITMTTWGTGDTGGGSTWQVWGDPHEKLNGKHIKDWEGRHRTVLLPGGVRVTMHALGPTGVVLTTSIYEGAESHRVDNESNTVLHSCVNAEVARERAVSELQGETATGLVLGPQRMVMDNIFTAVMESEPGAEPVVAFEARPLGITGGTDNPNEVNKLYEKPEPDP